LQKNRGPQNFLLPWNDLPMPDLSEMVMRWLGDWPEDKDESLSSKQRQTARQKKKDAKLNSDASSPHLETFDGRVSSGVSVHADCVKHNGSKPSASKRKNRKKKKK